MFDCVALIKQPLGIVLGKIVHHGINPLHLYSLQLLEKYVIIITITKTRIFFFRITYYAYSSTIATIKWAQKLLYLWN